MSKKLETIFELENAEKYSEAYFAYRDLISENKNFKNWQYYFSFLWLIIEGPLEEKFDLNIDLRIKLKEELVFGIENFSQIAEFNFLAGYIVSLFPYEFGDYDEFERMGKKMIKRAVDMNPENPIYWMVYLGSEKQNKKGKELYKNYCLQSQNLIKIKYKGKGLLHRYFSDVLLRDGEVYY